MKTNFDLEMLYPKKGFGGGKSTLMIIGSEPHHNPYVTITTEVPETNSYTTCAIKDKDLERLAVNILTAFKSKRLKPLKPKK